MIGLGSDENCLDLSETISCPAVMWDFRPSLLPSLADCGLEAMYPLIPKLNCRGKR